MAKRRFLGRLRAAVVVAFLGGTGQAHAIACADPVTYLYICCPKPCQINDGQNIIQNVLKESMEVSKLTSMISQMTAWKDQLSMFGQTLNMINSLISQLFGARGAAFSGFGNPTLIPQGLTGNPFNIGQMAGQVGNVFFRPGATQGAEIDNAARRTGLVSAGYIESMASGINGRTTLVTAQTEFRDLTKVVNNAASTDTGGSRDENDVNVHTDLAAMNQTRIAMLRSTQNQLTSANVQLMTDSYNALGKMGVDNQADRSGWSGGLSTGEIEQITPALTKLARNGTDLDARADLLAGVVGSLVRGMFVTPAQAAEPIRLAQASTTTTGTAATSPYGSAKGDYDSALANGFTNPDAVAAAKSSDAFQNYDNLMERAVQVHNAATAYVSMMGTIQLNQETIALYNLTLAAATEQRRRVVEGLSLFYSNPDAAFSAMAIEAVGPDAMSGMDPYQYGDSVSQQAAAAAALKTISTKVQYQLGIYGSPVCRDVWRYNNRWVAQFMSAPAQWTPVLQAIYANPQQETCGKLLSQWLNTPAAPLYDAATDTSGLNITGADIDPSNAAAVSTAALNEFLSDSNNSIQGPNFTYWIELAKRGIWMKDYAAHASEVIANTRTAITDLQANTNDPSTTLVLQSLPGIGPVDLTNGAGVQAQVNTLITTAATWRGQVDATTLGNEAVALRDTQLQAAGLVIKGDAAFQKWASAAPAMTDVPCATQQCWGAGDSSWAQPATVMGQNVGPKNPGPALPIVAADALTTQPTNDQAMSYCATLSVNTPDKSFVSCPVQPQAGFYPTALTPAPFGTGIGIQP